MISIANPILKMPQSFHVVRCYKCLTFQTDIVKKSNKWQCKVCGDKQSIKKVFCTGTGLECRSAVQQLNLQIGLASQLAEQTALDDFNHPPAPDDFNHPLHDTHPVDDDNHPHEQFPTNDEGSIQSEHPPASRWAAFLPPQAPEACSQSQTAFLPPDACSQSQSKPNRTNFDQNQSKHASTASNYNQPQPSLSSTFAAKRSYDTSQSFPKPSNPIPIKRPKLDFRPNQLTAFPSKSSFSKPIEPTPLIPKVMKLPAKSTATIPKIQAPIPKMQPPKSFSTDFAKRFFQPLQNKSLPSRLPPKPVTPYPSPQFKDNITNSTKNPSPPFKETSAEWPDQNEESSPESSTASGSRWTKFLPKTSEDSQ